MPATRRSILFVTGTRADFGKLKPLILRVKQDARFEYRVFATGMHLLRRYGLTLGEVLKTGLTEVFPYINQDASVSSQMDLVLANTIIGLGHYAREFTPDLIVVHGDRIEALAGALVGVLNNVRVAHIEGGEVSGTVDEIIRHAITKLSHVHFVANHEAARRLRQLGELPESVFAIGSPETDVLLSPNLPSIAEVKDYYKIPFEQYVIFLYHPVTTELDALPERIEVVLRALKDSMLNVVAIYPNNDSGSEIILHALRQAEHRERFRLLPSMRFESFLTLLKSARAIVGNSSSGVREAPVYGVPTVNIGSRQTDRYNGQSVLNVREDYAVIRRALAELPPPYPPSLHFGNGESAIRFVEVLGGPAIWSLPIQKRFRDVRFSDTPSAVAGETQEDDILQLRKST